MSLFLLALFTLPAIADVSNTDVLGDSSALGAAELFTFLWNLLPPNVQTALIGYLAIVGLFRHAGKLSTTVFHKYCEATETKADDEFLAKVENSRALRAVLFWIDLLLSWKPYRGPATPTDSNPNTPTDPRMVNLPPRPEAPVIPRAAGMIAFFLGVLFLAGCARLQPGASPIVVRTEQLEKSAKATFDLVLGADNRRREFFKTNAPAFHGFCEWLRQPLPVDGRNYPRAAALIKNVSNVKLAFKTGRASSNDVVTVITTLESAAVQATFWKTNFLKLP